MRESKLSSVTRIIAGFAGSRELKVPAAGTRPTSDRVREAVFGALEARDSIDSARVLDLYCGSGALGLEAISRGATHATLVEKNLKAAGIAALNAALVRTAGSLAEGATKVVTSSVSSFLDACTEVFDLVFVDPPYDVENSEVERVLAQLEPHLSEWGEIILERSSRTPAPSLTESLSIDRIKEYGETTIYWISRSE